MLFPKLHLLACSALAVTCAGNWAPPRPTPGPQYPSLPSWRSNYINYTTVTGFFLQDENSTDPSTFDYSTVNFGLLNRTYPTDNECDASFTQWQKFGHYVDTLNERSEKDVDYKVLFMGRHGEGYHNTAQTYYGTPAWNCYWSLQDGNGTVTWEDARLTPNGVLQAQSANTYWASRIALQKIPLPQSYYTSPLTRCLQTSNITFFGLPLPRSQPFIPTVKELFREGISGHTCDHRGNKTYIHDAYPKYVIEQGFTEEDELWILGVGETTIDQEIRSQKVLDEVFRSDKNTWLSITSHSGEIASILTVLNHQVFGLNTGQIIPVLVKAQTISGTAPTTASTPWTTISTCSTVPPLPTAT